MTHHTQPGNRNRTGGCVSVVRYQISLTELSSPQSCLIMEAASDDPFAVFDAPVSTADPSAVFDAPGSSAERSLALRAARGECW